LPEWRVTAGGKRKHLGGRWNKERIAEVLIEDRQKEFSMDDLARLVYGSTSKKQRDNVRKHIPAQRNHMMARLTPFVTRYGPRGTIESIKLYEADEPEDVRSLSVEINRLRDRREITHERYEQLRRILSLPAD
jgi:hypothetical protein